MTASTRSVLLTFDRGNTNLSCHAWGVDAGAPKRLGSTRARVIDAGPSILDVWLDEVLGSLAPDASVEAVGSSVVPEGLREVRAALKPRGWHLIEVPAQLGPSMPLDYETMETLGSDRWLAALGAHRGVGGVAVVVDAGSCVTVDGVLSDGTFVGGAIAPGLAAISASLASAAPSLPQVDSPVLGERLPASPARNSLDAVRLGVCVGFLGAVEKLVDDLLLDPRMKGAGLVLTGGDAPWLSGAMEWPPPRTRARLAAAAQGESSGAAGLEFAPLAAIADLVHHGLLWLWLDARGPGRRL